MAPASLPKSAENLRYMTACALHSPKTLADVIVDRLVHQNHRIELKIVGQCATIATNRGYVYYPLPERALCLLSFNISIAQ